MRYRDLVGELGLIRIGEGSSGQASFGRQILLETHKNWLIKSSDTSIWRVLQNNRKQRKFISQINSRVHTAGCKSTYHRWQVPPGGAPVVSGGENAAGCNLPPTKLDLPPTIYL